MEIVALKVSVFDLNAVCMIVSVVAGYSDLQLVINSFCCRKICSNERDISREQ